MNSKDPIPSLELLVSFYQAVQAYTQKLTLALHTKGIELNTISVPSKNGFAEDQRTGQRYLKYLDEIDQALAYYCEQLYLRDLNACIADEVRIRNARSA